MVMMVSRLSLSYLARSSVVWAISVFNIVKKPEGLKQFTYPFNLIKSPESAKTSIMRHPALDLPLF